jgi:hypothetical protein
VNSALRDLKALGEFPLRGTAPGLEEEQHGEQAVGFHRCFQLVRTIFIFAWEL